MPGVFSHICFPRFFFLVVPFYFHLLLSSLFHNPTSFSPSSCRIIVKPTTMYEYTKDDYLDMLPKDWNALSYHGFSQTSTQSEAAHISDTSALEIAVHPLFRYANKSKHNSPQFVNPFNGETANQNTGHRDGKLGHGSPFGVKWRGGNNYLSKEAFHTLSPDLQPVFKLASAILLSPASLDFFWRIIYGGREIMKGQPYRIMPLSPHFNARTIRKHRQEARTALNELAKSLSWVIMDKEDPYIATSHARTKSMLFDHPQGINIRNDGGARKGLASLITINSRSLTFLKEMRNATDDEIAKLHSLRLQLALIFCHEMAHVADFAVASPTLQLFLASPLGIPVDGTGYDEPFFEDQKVAELRHA